MKRMATAFLGLCAAASAAAAPLSQESLQERFSGAELRLTLHGSEHQLENHLWRFRADGTVRGYIYYVETFAGGGTRHVERQDTGVWRVAEGDRICVSWQQFFFTRGNETCFTVDEGYRPWVRLQTDRGATWTATLHRWQPGAY